MKKYVVVALMVALSVSLVLSAELGTKQKVPSEISDDTTQSSTRGPGAAPGESCGAGVALAGTEGPIGVSYLVPATSCSTVDGDYICLLIFGSAYGEGLTEEADGQCRGNAYCSVEEALSDFTKQQVNGDCLLTCYGTAIEGTCERANGGGPDPFK